MKKKNQQPLPLRIIRWAFPKLETVAPALAGKWAWKLFFTPFRFKPPEVETQVGNEADKFRFKVNHMEIQGYEWGKGQKTVLVLHGWAGRATQFRKFIEPLNQMGYKVVGIDGPSHGKSNGSKTDILEFVEVIKEVKKKYPEIDTIIAHSFGGAASMMAIREGVKIARLINIGSPTDGDYIIADFLRRINGSPKSGERFKQKVIDLFNKPFSNFSIKESIKYVPELQLLMIHDENDKEVPVQHPIDVHNAHPETQLILTEGLGHMRILKDAKVIEHCMAFIKNEQLEKVVA